MIDDLVFTNPGTQFISIVIGIVILLLGRRLFWFAVGGVGFIAGLILATQLFVDQSPWIILVAALLAGVIGAILAIFVQQAAVSIAGFIMGGYTVIWLLEQLMLDFDPWNWILFIVGGVIGFIVALSLWDIALVILSALAGALLIVQPLNFSPIILIILFVALFILGVTIQMKTLPEKS